jgi:hypothetical protein
VRFLPEFDGLLLSHSNRTRVIADEHRSKVYQPGLRVAATILVDGFVCGAWKIEKTQNAATLVIEPIAKLTKPERAALIEEGERLVRFVEATDKSFAVRFASPVNMALCGAARDELHHLRPRSDSMDWWQLNRKRGLLS